MPYSVVDLFAGAGGLSLGFMQTGKYDIKVAFEREPHMQATYHQNHPNVELQKDVCGADYADIQRRYGTIDVVIGGPPCQGFSNANRQKSHAISQNNMLIKQYIRAIRELQPKAFVMENVSMLRSDVHRFYMEEADLDIVEEYQIPNKNTPLRLLNAEFVFDGALEIVQNLDLLQQRLWPENHYQELNIIYKGEKNADKM
ncbi:MAG: DNA cytosine methyltransferase, partial [Ruminococcus flavefaciens]|nr:DNA cytosine methyltransferase [Ruminococcus flavefaciens]